MGTTTYSLKLDSRRAEKSLQAMLAVLSKIDTTFDKVDKSFKALDKSLGNVSKEMNAFTKATKASNDSLGETNKKAKDAGLGILKLDAATNLAAKGVAVLQKGLDALRVPVGLAKGFERQFNMIRTLSASVTSTLRSDLLQLASEVPQTAADITQAAYQAISSGIKPPDVTQFLRSASELAVAGGASLTESVVLLTTAVNSYEKQGLSAAHATDIMLATVQKGITTIPELTASFGGVASTAANAGLRIEEVAGAIAAITKVQGGNTSEAVTQLNALIKVLSNPPVKTAKIFKEIGFEFGPTALRAKGLREQLRLLQKAAEDSGVEMSTLTRRNEALQAILKLSDNSLIDMSDAAGATAFALSKVSGDTENLLSQVSALSEHLMRSLGDEVLPSVKESLRELLTLMGNEGPALVSTLASGMTDLSRVFVDFVKTQGSNLVKVLGSAFTAMAETGSFISEHGDTMIKFMVSFFAVSRITAFTTAIKRDLLPSMALVGKTGGLGAIITQGLRSPLFLATIGVIGFEIGQTLMESYRKPFLDGIEEAGRLAEEQMKTRLANLKKLLADQGFESVEDKEKTAAGVASGDIIATDLTVGSTGGLKFSKGATTSASSLVAQQGAEKAIETSEALASTLRLAGERAQVTADIERQNELQAIAHAEESKARLDELKRKYEEFDKNAGFGLGYTLTAKKMRKDLEAAEAAHRENQTLAAAAERARIQAEDTAAGLFAGADNLQLSVENAAAMKTETGMSGSDLVEQNKPKGPSEAAKQRKRDQEALQKLREEFAQRELSLIADTHERSSAMLASRHNEESEQLAEFLNKGLASQQDADNLSLLHTAEKEELRTKIEKEASEKRIASLQKEVAKKLAVDQAAAFKRISALSAESGGFVGAEDVRRNAQLTQEKISLAQSEADAQLEVARAKGESTIEIELSLQERLAQIREEGRQRESELIQKGIDQWSSMAQQGLSAATSGLDAYFETQNASLVAAVDQAKVSKLNAKTKGEEEKAAKVLAKAEKKLAEEREKQQRVIAGIEAASAFANAGTEIAKAAGSYPDPFGIAAHSLAAVGYITAGAKWAAVAGGSGGSPSSSIGVSSAAGDKADEIERGQRERDERRREAMNRDVAMGSSVTNIQLYGIAVNQNDVSNAIRTATGYADEVGSRGRYRP